MATQNVTAAEFLGPPLADKLTANAKSVKISQLAQLRKDIARHKPSKGSLAALTLADLHSIRDAFAPYAEGEMKVNSAAAACCCCCPCCSCGCACSSCCP